MIRSHLAQANGHIAELTVQITRQRVIVKYALDTGQPSGLSESLLHALEESLARSRSIANWFSISGYADRPSKGDHPSAPTRRCVATGRDLSQRRQPQNGRHDHFTNAGACRPVRCPADRQRVKESPGLSNRGFK